MSAGPAETLGTLFADLRRVDRGEIIAEHPERHLQGTRLGLERTQGHGFWELYRLDQDFYVVVADGIYETPRVETVPGEGLVEFHLRLNGVLDMTLGDGLDSIRVRGPRLLMMHQPAGVTARERVTPKLRDTGVSLYCRPALLGELARRSGISAWPLLEQILDHPAHSVWHQQIDLSPALLYLGNSLVKCSYRRGIRLLYAEAKALELLCEVLATQQTEASAPNIGEYEGEQLDTARRLLATKLSAPPRICDVARTIGMSESKLKRLFKVRFGATVFDYGLECRMRYAFDLLYCKRMSVGEVAFAVGYQHQTSFAAAFQAFYGIRPSAARPQPANAPAHS